MNKDQLFGSVAEFYEYSMRNNCDYSGWAKYVTDIIKKANPSAKTGLDVACGSGFFTRALKKVGYDVTGIDIQPEMLTAAKNECSKERLNLTFMLGDMTNLKVFNKVDFITVINDGINCLPSEKLIKAFKSMANALKKGGILHFDVSSEYKLKQVIANNTFCEDDDEYSYIWFNALYEDRVEMDMSVFLKRGEHYVKKESTLTEYIHTDSVLENALEQAGFKVLFKQGDMNGEFSKTSERLNLTAVKL